MKKAIVEREARLCILDELLEVMKYVPKQADGNISGKDFVEALYARKTELNQCCSSNNIKKETTP